MWCIASLFWHDRFQWSESASARSYLLAPLQDVPSIIPLVSIVYGQFMHIFRLFCHLLQLISDPMLRWHEYQKRVHYYNHIRLLFFVRFGVVWIFFSTLPLFTLWHAIAILIVFFTLYALFAYFTFISCFGKLNTRHQSNVRCLLLLLLLLLLKLNQ